MLTLLKRCKLYHHSRKVTARCVALLLQNTKQRLISDGKSNLVLITQTVTTPPHDLGEQSSQTTYYSWDREEFIPLLRSLTSVRTKKAFQKKNKGDNFEGICKPGRRSGGKSSILNIILAASCPVQYTGDYTARAVI